MNTYANSDLIMPAHYVDMSEKEMEYDSGLFGFTGFCFYATIVGLACTAISHSGIIKDEGANRWISRAGYFCTAVGVVSLGVGLAAAAGSGAALSIMGASTFGQHKAED